MGFFILKHLRISTGYITRCGAFYTLQTPLLCAVLLCASWGALIPEKLSAQDSTGYRLDQDNVVFIFQPHRFTHYTTPDGTLKQIENLSISTVAVACEANAWSTTQWRMNKINEYWYELRVPYAVFEKKTRGEFKFFVNGEYWAEPMPPITNIVALQATGKTAQNRSTKLYNLTAHISQPSWQLHTFRLTGFPNARQVYVAGTFNDWNKRAIRLTKNGNEWSATVPLKPAGYSYKFIVDGMWKLDPASQETVEDGTGHTNSFVIIPSVQGSTLFALNGYSNAKKVAVSGTFNGWNPERHYFAREQNKAGATWTCRLNIHPGYYEYRFVVDGLWIRDPLNPLSAKNEYEDYNSVLLLPSTEGNVEFSLKGYDSSKMIALAGTFNDWSKRRHLFFRQGDQWICRVRLKPGSYKYKFVVDGEWILDPQNNQVVENEFNSGNNVLTVK